MVIQAPPLHPDTIRAMRADEAALRDAQRTAHNFALFLDGGLPDRATKMEVLRRLAVLNRLVRQAPVIYDGDLA